MGYRRLFVLATTAVALSACGAAWAEPPSQSATWDVIETTVPLTGAASVVAQLPSTNMLSNMIGAQETASLVLRCQEGALAAYVFWPQVLQISGTSFGGASYQTMVLWRMDASEIAVNFWDRSDAGTSAGKFTTGGASKIIAKLFMAHRLVVRMTGSTTQDAEFDLGDIQAVATRVGKPCGVTWTPPK